MVNIIGKSIPKNIIKQLKLRSEQTSKTSRDTKNLIYLANKTSFLRVVSSVNVNAEEVSELKKNHRTFSELFPDANSSNVDASYLAKNFSLFAGTSKYDDVNRKYGLRSGLGLDGAYGTLGTKEIQEFGYRPMPGITSVTIDTAGRMGSIRYCTINFKVWDKMQLDIVDLLYFKLGFSIFVEWGQTFYYKASDSESPNPEMKLYYGEELSIDPFYKDENKTPWTKEELSMEILKKSQESEGNYDAMLGLCTNFNFALNQEGGYDCSVKIIGLGYLADSLKVNQPKALSDVLKAEVKKIVNKANKKIEDDARKEDEKINATNRVLFDQQKSQNQKEIEELNKKLSKNILAKIVTSYAPLQIPPESARYGGNKQKNISGAYEVKTYKNLPISEAGKINFSSFSKEEYDNLSKFFTQYPDLVRYPSKYNGKTPPNSEEEVKALDFVVNTPAGRLNNTVEQATELLMGRFNIIYSKKVNQQYSFTVDRQYLKDLISRFYPDFFDVNKRLIKNERSALGPEQETVPIRSTSQFLTQALSSVTSPLTAAIGIFTDTSNWRYETDQLTYTFLKFKYFVVPSIIQRRDYYFNVAISNYGIKKTSEYINAPNKIQIEEKLKAATLYKFISGDYNDGDVVFSVNSNVTDFSANSFDLKATFEIKVSTPNTEVFSKNPRGGDVIRSLVTADVPYNIEILISTDDSSIFKSVDIENEDYRFLDEKEVQEKIAKLNPEFQEQKTIPKTLDAAEIQTQETSKYRSGLELALRAIQLYSINKTLDLAEGVSNVLPVRLLEKNEKGQSMASLIFSSNGAFKNIFNDLINNKAKFVLNNDELAKRYLNQSETNLTEKERLTINTLYGFSTELMSSKTFDQVKQAREVDFDSLLYSYVVPYSITNSFLGSGKEVPISNPVYVNFGFLMFLLNHLCMMYESSSEKIDQNSNIKPLFYLDFNTESNLCLSVANHISVDPLKFLVPCYASQEQVSKLFDDTVVKFNASKNTYEIDGKNDQDKKEPEKEEVFDPQKKDLLSEPINITSPFKFYGKGDSKGYGGNTAAYKGKIMNVLISIDYILALLNDFSAKDGNNTVYMRSFLEQIISDMNKAMGSFNILRLAYNDFSNTMLVMDDQIIPEFIKSNNGTTLLEKMNNDSEIPLYGYETIARNLEIKTEISTKLANMIAISANPTAEFQNSLSQDASSFGFLNRNLQDRYMKWKIDNSSSKTKKQLEEDISTALRFNQLVGRIFYGKEEMNASDASFCINYYTEALSGIKSKSEGLQASAMIPVSLNFTTDGIAGVSMYNSFTVSDELLPYTYNKRRLGDDIVKNKVGFCIIGLTHTLENNQWTTSVRTNMIYVKDEKDYTKDKKEKDKLFSKLFLSTAKGSFEEAQVGSQNTSYSGSDIIKSTPWSAAFISYVMNKANINFVPNSSHTGYLNSLRSNPSFKLLDPSTTKIQLGDVVVLNREGNTQKFSSIPYSGFSHGDIIVSISENFAEAIGGNVSNTVYKSNYTLKNGLVTNYLAFVIARPIEKIEDIVLAAQKEYNLWSSNNWKESTAAARDTLKLYYNSVGISI